MNNWSQTYFNTDGIVTADLTPDQHNANNRWFKSMLDQLTDRGQLTSQGRKLIYEHPIN